MALCHPSFEPVQHFLAFLPALDFQQTAVFLAISVHITEGSQKLLELVSVHDVSNHADSHICELVGVDTTEEVSQLFIESVAHINLAACQSEAGRLDAHIEFGDVAAHMEGDVVMLADLACQGESQSLFAVDAAVGGSASDVGNSHSSHSSNSFLLGFPCSLYLYVITDTRKLQELFFILFNYECTFFNCVAFFYFCIIIQ